MLIRRAVNRRPTSWRGLDSASQRRVVSQRGFGASDRSSTCRARQWGGSIIRRVSVLLTVLVLSTVGLAAPASAGESCHTIKAKGVGQDVGDFATVAQIQGGGLLQGTTAAQFVPGILNGTELAFSGDIVFTTNRATLTVSLSGTFDLATGFFTAAGPVTGATGKLAGASGMLAFEGVQDFAAGTFTETVTGEICVDLGANGTK